MSDVARLNHMSLLSWRYTGADAARAAADDGTQRARSGDAVFDDELGERRVAESVGRRRSGEDARYPDICSIGLTPAEKEVLDSVNSWLKLGVSPAGLTPV